MNRVSSTRLEMGIPISILLLLQKSSTSGQTIKFYCLHSTTKRLGDELSLDFRLEIRRERRERPLSLDFLLEIRR